MFLYTEFTGDNFWEIWSAIKSGAYHDEKMKKYASKELELYRKIFIEGPIAPVTTSDFLSQDGYFTFWKPPPELGGEENYYISDLHIDLNYLIIKIIIKTEIIATAFLFIVFILFFNIKNPPFKIIIP